MSRFDIFLSHLRTQRDSAESELEDLRVRLESMSKLLNTLEDLAKNTPPEVLDQLADTLIARVGGAGHETAKSHEGASPKAVVQAAQEVLRAERRPMRRGELVLALRKRGVQVAGQDKSKNLGTILWRHSNLFVNLGRLGYWLANEELPGVYVPAVITE